MKAFNFSSMEYRLLSAMEEAYKSTTFDADGGYLYFSLRNLLQNEIRYRLQDIVKREKLEDTVEQAMETADNYINIVTA